MADQPHLITPSRSFKRYAVAVLLVLIAAGLRLAFLESLGTRAAFVTFYPAVVLAALYGGLWPGLVATALSAFVADFFWIEPIGRFTFGQISDIIATAIFVLSCATVSFIAEAMHRARSKLITDQDHLEATVKRGKAELEQEIVERKQGEAALVESEHRLKVLNENLENMVVQRTVQVRSLSRALALAEQRERKRFAQLLHEDLQQVLLAVRMQVNYDFVDQQTIQIAKDEAAEAKRLIDKALKITRSLALELNPPILRGEGLQAALSWLISHIEKNYGLTVKLDMKQIPDITEDVHIMIIQMVRELLVNVAKHSGVKMADVCVDTRQDTLAITVADKGKGFDMPSIRKMEKRVGYGLFGIDERLRIFGGKLDLVSEPGKGTTATLIIPLEIF